MIFHVAWRLSSEGDKRRDARGEHCLTASHGLWLPGLIDRTGIDMTRALVPLSMSNIGQLPEGCRSCVSWELPRSTALKLNPGEAAFEKEVWLSGVMLTWGSAGQIVTVDDQPAGFALFAPPTAVPAASVFPTSPVSPDAVLLTTGQIRPEFAGQGLGRFLMNGVMKTLSLRGVRAIEMFGLQSPPVPGSADPAADPDSTAAPDGDPGFAEPDPIRAALDPNLPTCLLPADFARAVGFKDVAPHHQYPRLRYELDGDIGWKFEVESALEKLFTVITVPAPLQAQLIRR